MWLFLACLVIGFGIYLFSYSPLLAPAPTESPTQNFAQFIAPSATQAREPDIVRACVSDITNIRRGPGTHYETIGGLVTGTCLMILGRNDEGSWAFIVSDNHQTGWVAVSVLGDIGDISGVSIRGNMAVALSYEPTLTSAEVAHGAEVYLTSVAATNIPRSPLSRYRVPCFETANRLGQDVSCRMERAYCDYVPSAEGGQTVCNDRPYPDHAFTLVVPGEDWRHYDGQCIIVSGHLAVSEGTLQIKAHHPSQVYPCD